MKRTLYEELAGMIHHGGSRKVRWYVRLAVLTLVCVCGFLPYDHKIGGECRTVPALQRGVRAQISDEIVQVHVRQGDRVEPGDSIAKLAVRDERAAVAAATAELEEARANLELLRHGTRVREALEAAEANVKRIEARLEYDRELVKLGDLLAPIAGTVVTPNTQEREGQYVEEGDLIAVIHDLSRICVVVASDEAAASRVDRDMPVEVRLNGLDGFLLHGRVASVSPNIVDDAEFDVEHIRTDREAWTRGIVQRVDDHHVRIYVELNKPDDRLRPGMTGYAKIVVGSSSFWHALARPIMRFLRVEVWSWLP